MTKTIVSLHKGQNIPDKLMSNLEQQNFSLVAFAAQENGGVESCVFQVEKDTELATTLKAARMAFENSECSMHFGPEVAETDQQPFPLLVVDSSEGKVLLSAMLEGDFPTFNKGEGHTSEYYVVRDFLTETVKEAYQDCKEDLGELMKTFNSSIFKRSVAGIIGKAGTVLLIPGSGTSFVMNLGALGEGGTGGRFKWGWTTHTFGYTEEQPVAATSVPTAGTKMTNAERIKAMVASKMAAAQAAEPAPTKTEPEPAPVTNPDEFASVITQNPNGAGAVIKCSAKHQGEARKKWISRNLLPQYQFMKGWEGDVLYKMDMFKPNSGVLEAHKRTLPRPKSFEEAADKLKAAAAQHPRAEIAKDQATVVEGFTGILGPKAKQHAIDLITEDSRFTVSPLTIEDIEKDYDPFTTQLQINPDIPLFYGPETFRTIAQQNVDWAGSLMHEFAMRIIKSDPKIKANMLAKISKGTTPEEVTAPPVKMTNAERIKAMVAEKAKKVA